MPHDRGFAFEEILPQGAPFNGPLGHDPVFLSEAFPVLQRSDHGRIVEIGRIAVPIHQHLAVFHGQCTEQPVRVSGGRNHNPPLRAVRLGQFFTGSHHFVPGCRRFFRVQAGSTKRILVVVHDDGGALEGNAPGLSRGAAVFHQARIKGIQPGLFFSCAHHIVKCDNGILLDQFIDIDGKHHRQLRRLSAFQGGQRLDTGIVVIAGVNGFDGDIRVLFHKIGNDAVDDLGQRPTDGHRIVHGQFRG